MKFMINQKNIIQKWLLPTLLILAFVVLAALSVYDQSGLLLSADLRVTHMLQSFHPMALTKAMIAVSWFGYAPQIVFLVILTAAALVVLHKRRQAIELIVSCFCTLELTSIFKSLIHHPRPNASQAHVFLQLHDYSFPSGHVVFYVVFFGFLWYLVYTLSRSYKRTIGLILLGIPIVSIGYSRVFLGEHWASDVVGGYILGCLILMACIRFEQWRKARTR